MSDLGAPSPARRFAIQVVRQLRQAGFEALWAGGCVRDQLLGLTPSDYDVATSAKPPEIRRLFGRRRTLAIGAAFGVINVLGNREEGQVEVATFRCDSAYSDGRHPDQVTFSTAREDAVRRDFTINGLFLDPLTNEVIDYVGGRQDLECGILRAIGDPFERLAEDKLRMLRAARFAATFEFQLEPATAAAIRQQAAQLQVVSAERIAAELRRMLVHSNRHVAVHLLSELELLSVLLPEIQPLTSSTDSSTSQTAHPEWQETLAILASLEAPSFRVALAALLWHLDRHQRQDPPSLVRRVGQRWKLSNDETSGTRWLLEHEPTIRQATQLRWSQLQRLLISPDIAELLQLATAIATVQDDGLADIQFCRDQLRRPNDQLDPAPLINGNDLRQAGFPRGPLYGKILKHVRNAQLDETISTRAEALEMARAIAATDS